MPLDGRSTVGDGEASGDCSDSTRMGAVSNAARQTQASVLAGSRAHVTSTSTRLHVLNASRNPVHTSQYPVHAD